MIKSGAFLFYWWLESEPLSLFVGIQLQWLECSAASLLTERQRAPQGQKLHPPHILSEPLSLFNGIQLQWLESIGHFTPSNEAKNASLSGVPMSKDSERATFAFY
ncbi:hypothetical protein [Bacillus wiedmannii]|uniref:hypothetical protein n=1 Tax=Bacillus wiedmannii TaxID=1890302 RepID=UPI0015CF388D|nr:hypothetical protein [Bacillus wiedmannii]